MTETLAAGTYEILRARLRDAAGELRSRFEQLNQARAEVFGNIETRLKSTAHVTTDHNCMPRDILAINEWLLLGYNVQFGLQTDIRPEDVFALYRMEEDIAHTVSLSEILDDRLRRDFSELYRYYKNTSFSRFYSSPPHQYFVFQVGKSFNDIKAFKFLSANQPFQYVDNRSEQEVRLPSQHSFQWKRTNRDQHRSGNHPHISIEDIIFVECVQGDLTIKIEDNTQTGTGIYSEPVENSDQTLDDAEIHYCVLGNLVLLRVKPYQERDFRHLVYSKKLDRVYRLDGISRSCVFLPQDHGIIFSGGFVLQTGEHKLFDHGLENLLFERMIAAPNGEDYLYVFFDPNSGTYLHLRYNVICQSVDIPLVCSGFALFDDGRLITIRASGEPQKHHALQLWQTPFISPNFKVEVATDSMLFKIGNRELVTGMAECQELMNLIEKDDTYQDLYMDLVKRSTDILDSYHWIAREETFRLDEPLVKIREAATAAVEEFDKVVRVRRDTENATQQARQATEEILKSIQRSNFETIEQFVGLLSALRQQRGHVIGLRELRYVQLEAVDQLEKSLIEANDRLGLRCVQFLLSPKSLDTYQNRIQASAAKIEKVSTASDGRALQEEFAEIGRNLELLIDTVSQLKIEDLTQRTAIVDRTGNLLAELNRVRSTLAARLRELVSHEMEADFASQTRLLDQAAAGAIETADTPEKIDEALTRMMLQLEELEGRFAEVESLLPRLTEKRESLYEAFEAKRLQLVEARSRRADSLVSAADRILQGISSRALRLQDADALRSYLASDAMVDKIRQIADQLKQLGDTVRMDDVLSRLKAIGDDSLRQLRDRQELFSGEDGLIQLGKHQFSVNRQPIELTTVVKQGLIQLHLTGTQFFSPMQDPMLDSAKDLWEQTLPSETEGIYRGEYLAAIAIQQMQQGQLPFTAKKFLDTEDQQSVEWIRSLMQSRHDEGYSRGVHDQDATRILRQILQLEQTLHVLRFSPWVRGVANFAWLNLIPQTLTTDYENWMRSLAGVIKVMPQTVPSQGYISNVHDLLQQHALPLMDSAATASGCHLESTNEIINQASEYLFQTLLAAASVEDPSPLLKRKVAVSTKAGQILASLNQHLPSGDREKIRTALNQLSSHPLNAWTIAVDAVRCFTKQLDAAESGEPLDPATYYSLEVAALLLNQEVQPDLTNTRASACRIEGLVGDHPRIKRGVLELNYYHYQTRIRTYMREVLPRFRGLRDTKHRLLHAAEKQLRVSEFKAKVLTSFVRNRLIDEVYLPLIGDNLAKQIGAAGDSKRSDRMGLLLLISPPGYGKTTLMEYVANRLGLVFVKVNGPALGHKVTSLDPAEATNASAREEIKRINLALEMGDNVMLYLDDIQHCNSELLQKFIPLCDATRRIEGVWDGQPKSYDLRGRKVAVVMAGNPYTESGERFQIPDMLANRADVYNLGEIIGDAREAFELSYIENCLTSNSVLQPLSRLSNKDQRSVIRAAEIGSTEGLELESNLTSDQLSEMTQVLAKLLKVRDIVLRVNRAYIRSAAQVDAYRTEPPFKLQGSYRNMNRMAERVVPVMNDQELQTLIIANYEQDAQTLTRDGEANLLKFKELLGVLTSEEAERWENIKYAFVESVRMQGMEGEDSTAQVLRTLAGLRDGLESIRKTMSQAIAKSQQDQSALAIQEGMSGVHQGIKLLASQLQQSAEAAIQASQAASQKLPDQKVIVQHSVPRVMTDLVQSQFQLLFDGLRPVLEASAQSRNQLESLRKSIDDCLKQYQAIQEVIQKSVE